MIKKAVIAPVSNLELTKAGDMHMVLTHLVFKHESYADFYAKERKYKVLDNSACEGELQTIERVCAAAAMVGANEIILPDIVYDGASTIRATKESLEYLDSSSKLDVKTMAVVQGSTQTEWWECYAELATMKGVDVVGFSKLSCPRCFGLPVSEARKKIVADIEKRKMWPKDKEVHLLGGSYQVLDEMKFMSEYPQIRSIDTSAPIEFGKRRLELGRFQNIKEKPARLDKGIRPYNQRFVEKNIQSFMEVNQ